MSGARRIVLAPFDRDLYERTGNGMHAWAAYRRTRQHDGWPEEWVLEYFDRCYKALKAPAGTASPDRIAAALQLRTEGGGPSARARAMTAQRAQAIVTHILAYRLRAAPDRQRLTQRQSDDILDRVADKCGLSFERVRTIWFARNQRKVSKTR
jgi:hypothetical protein